MDRPTADAPTPRLRHAVLAFGLLTAGYVAVLLWIDARNPMFEGIGRLLGLLPPMAGLSAIAYLARYARWRRLLGRAGHRTAWGRGLLAYLAGFAFTATPGKVGELVRMRYLGPLGVPNPVVLGAFVYERALDLLVVLALALLAIGDRGQLSLAAVFVATFVGGVVVVAARPQGLAWVAARLRTLGWGLPARICDGFAVGLGGCRRWFNPADLSIGALLGLVAWGLTAASFVWLLGVLGAGVPTLDAFAAYPLAMLAGAASMLPGGVGSTELAIVALLSNHSVGLQTATLAAVGIRLTTLWFSILCGLVSVALLEASDLRTGRPSVPNRTDPPGTGR